MEHVSLEMVPALKGENMEKPTENLIINVIRAIDKINDYLGKALAYLIIPLVGGLVYEVFARYLFHAPTIWAYELAYMIYGGHFMLGAAYALSKGGHIRTDIFYQKWTPIWQGRMDLMMYLVFFFPGMILFLVAGWDQAAHSWEILEKSEATAWRPPLYPFKTAIPIAAFLLLFQGVAEVLKSYYAARKGRWLIERVGDYET